MRKLIGAIVKMAVLGLVVMLLWNAVIPGIFNGLNHIGYWQAVSLWLLSRLLFGGFRGHGGRHQHRHHNKCGPDNEVTLKGGMSTPGVVRAGETVRRPVKENSTFVHDFLKNLEVLGFDRAPRFLGIDEKGREILSYIQGTVHRKVGGYHKEQWLAGARLLRRFHDATVACELKGDCEVVCHGDPGPGNHVFRDGMPFALIDFDGAHPGKREDDVGYAAWMWLHIGDTKITPEQQGANLMDFVAAYDAAASWNPLEAVLHAQRMTLTRLPNNFKWVMIKGWAKNCQAWTERNRERIAAGIAKRSAEIAGSREPVAGA